MAYRVRQETNVARILDKLPSRLRDLIVTKMLELGNDPRPQGCIKLKRTKQPSGWRIRVGKYRLLYTIDDAATTVVVYDVETRDQAYKDKS